MNRKYLLQKLLPKAAIQYYRKLRYGRKKRAIQQTPIEQIFTKIYEENGWGNSESVSGVGATAIQTEALVKQVNQLLADYSIKTLLDVPCGDFNWMQRVNLKGIEYQGADIVKELIAENKEKYRYLKGVHFFECDLTSGSLPKCDLIINRDCLVHLSYEDIWKALDNMSRSGSTYLLTTTFPGCPFNFDIPTGSWRNLNLEKKPFNFPKPLALLNEGCTEDSGMFEDKSMGLWKLDELPVKIENS